MTKSKMLFQAGALAALVTCTSVPAFAQTDATPPPSAPAATTSSVASGGGAGNGIGVGAAQWLSGLTGATVDYDQYAWDIEGVLGFNSFSPGNGGPRGTQVAIGASGWFHLAHGSSSDFSLGGGVGFASLSQGGASTQAFVIEPGAMVRVFLTQNVSLSGRVGLAMAFGDNGTAAGPVSGVTLSGQTTAALGFTYFFR